MSWLKESVLIEASVVPKEKIASNLAEILHLDLTTCKVEDFAEFYLDFEFVKLQQLVAVLIQNSLKFKGTFEEKKPP